MDNPIAIPGVNEPLPDELQMKITSDEKSVRFDFGKPVAWIAMPKPQALTFAFTVLNHCGVEIQQHDLTKGKPS